jgi:putative transposase
MVKKQKITKKDFNKIKEEEGEAAAKEAVRSIYKKRRLNGRVKFTLNMLSHYKFRQHLINKSNEYGCKVIIVTEEYTSKACTRCGIKSDKYKKRRKKCESCGYKIDRDINGSRNILIKNL